MKNPMTSSERRGILVVAAIALLITGAGLLVPECGRNKCEVSPEEVEVIVRGDSAGGESSGKMKEKREKRHKVSSSGKEKKKKTYRRRSPRDETV